MSETCLELNKATLFYTNVPEEAILVCEGTAYVYIVPWSEEKKVSGQRVFLCEVSEDHTIPSFSWRDQNYQQWRFLITSKTEKTVLKAFPGRTTRHLKKTFLESAGIHLFEQEGFEGSLVEFYKGNVLKGDVFIQRVEKQAPEEQKESFGAIGNVVNKKLSINNNHFNTIYELMCFACQKAGIRIADKKKIESNDAIADIEKIARLSGFICREVVLDVNWYKYDCGVLIANISGNQVVCYPSGNKYHVYNPIEHTECLLSRSQLYSMEPKAFSVRRTLPNHSLTKKDIVGFVKKSFYKRDVISLVLWGLISTLIGVLQPKLNQLIYDDYIPLGEFNVILQVCLIIASFMIGNVFISVVKGLQEYRLPCRAGYELQDATYWRLFQLPESFFRQFESADLAERVMGVSSLTNSITSLLVTNVLGAVLGLIYFIQMIRYSWKLGLVGLLMILIFGILVFFLSQKTIQYYKKAREYKGESTGKLYQFITGIDKIRMAGAGERAILEFLQPVTNEKKETIKANHIGSISSVLISSGATVFSMVLYYMMVKRNIGLSIGSFIAFNTAFGSFTGSVMGLVGALSEYMQTKPVIQRTKPIFETAVEDDSEKDSIDGLKGDIIVDRVTFGYSKDIQVLKDFSTITQNHYGF